MKYLTDYIPILFKKNDTMQSIYEVQDEELQKLYGCVVEIINNLYIQYCNEEGIKKFEEFYHIDSNLDYTLEQRKAALINKTSYRPPITELRFKDILKNIWGDRNYTFDIYPDIYTLVIDVNTIDPVTYVAFSKQVKKVIPSNLYLFLSIPYNYAYLTRNYIYEELNNLTYEELCKYNKIL